MEIRVTRDTMSDIYFDALRIRNQVFVKEQGVPYELEVGNALEEASSVHFVLYDGGLAKGTVRLLADLDKKTALIQRMAILKEARGHGYAKLLIDRLIEFAKESKLNKPELGRFAKAKLAPKKYLREFKLDSIEGLNVGDELKADVFEIGDKLDIQGTSKGKGFQGVIKRHGQARGPMGHGSMYHRRPGSMGPTSTPGRVFPGKKLPGHMGDVTVTIQNLEVVKIDLDKNVILVKGSVPGAKGSILKVKSTTRV